MFAIHNEYLNHKTSILKSCFYLHYSVSLNKLYSFFAFSCKISLFFPHTPTMNIKYYMHHKFQSNGEKTVNASKVLLKCAYITSARKSKRENMILMIKI